MKESHISKLLMKLLEYSTPHGEESNIVDILPIDLQIDDCGNYFTIVGKENPSVMFTSHLDNACFLRRRTNANVVSENGFKYIVSKNNILGADNKAGVSLMVNMIKNNIEGLYYFFIGEEVGTIGSSCLSKKFDDIDYLKEINHCVSFDRRGTKSIITHQSGIQTCSDEYAISLISQLNEYGFEFDIDRTGISCDSLNFISRVQECTNISVGYQNEHTYKESLNLTFLENLSEAVLKVKWDELSIQRKID